MLSKSCEYAIRAVIYLSDSDLESAPLSLKAISKEIGSPEAFTGKILQKLNKSGIIQSVKGKNGGFYLEKKRMARLRVKEIVDAIDGEESYNSCVLGLNECNSANPCPLHNEYRHIKSKYIEMLRTARIQHLREGVGAGKFFLRN